MRILFLDLDTLRADHLGCYGYHRNTSPNIDRIAAGGVRFDNYYCSDAPCLPSRSALVSGQFGIHTGIVGHDGTAADRRLAATSRGFMDPRDCQSLFTTLKNNAGMRTVSINPFAERHSAWWFNAGFSEHHNTGKCGLESAEDVTPTVLDWIGRNAAEDNWCLHVNYWDPHTVYRAPEAFGNPFANDPLPAWPTEEAVESHQQSIGPHTAREVMMYHSEADPQYPRHPGEIRNMDDLRKMIDGYDCGIRYMDEHIGKLFAALEEMGAMEDLAVIITADHAENMGEQGIYGEHATADHATCRIPMIIRWPGCKTGHADAGLHYNLDLAPTLADLLGLERKPLWDGRSYATSITHGEDTGRDFLVLSQCAHVCQRSVRMGDWLYIRTYHDGFHLFPKEMLFNITEDPFQQKDLASERLDVCREAAHRLLGWHDEMMSTMDSDVDPLWTVIREGGPCHAHGQLPTYCQRLEQTERGWAVPELKRRHPREFKTEAK